MPGPHPATAGQPGLPVRAALVAVGLISLLFGGWRLAVFANGAPDRYLLIERQETDEQIGSHAKALEAAEADLASRRESLNKKQIQMEEEKIKSLAQVHKAMIWHRDEDIEAARAKEAKLGFFTVLIGLGLLGFVVYTSFFARARAIAPVR